MSDIFPARAFVGCDLDIELAPALDVLLVQTLAEAGLTVEQARLLADPKEGMLS